MLGALDRDVNIIAVRLMTTPSFQNMLFVEIPEYRNKHIRTPVKVNFYVINGKRKRSQPQHFTYHPGKAFSSVVGEVGACARGHMSAARWAALGR